MNKTSDTVRQRLLAALEQSDIDRRNSRADRIEWLNLHIVQPSVMGRPETLCLFSEARDVFVDGHFLASLLVALAFIEHTIVEELQRLGYTNGSPSFGQALDLSGQKEVFPLDSLARVKVLSLRRNAFAHMKDEKHKHAFGVRILEEKRHPTSILESDAKEAIELMYNFFVATLR